METRRAVLISAVLILGLASCAPPEKAEVPGYDWRWTGKGRPGNFAADYSYCRRHVNTLWRLERRALRDRINRKPPPDSFAQRFPFRQCMKGRGWTQVTK